MPQKLPLILTVAETQAILDACDRLRDRFFFAVMADGAQVAQLRRTVTKYGRKTVEVVCLITSDRDADPATLASWVRSHWEIENCSADCTYG